MHFITDESELDLNKKNMALYFYAPWMPFHKKMLFMISKIECKYQNIVFYAIDADFFKNLCTRFEVDQIPTVIIRSETKELKRVVGITLTSAFKKIFYDILNK